jgi:hypothetical protein
MLALRTALGFSLSCSLRQLAAFKLCWHTSHLERSISTAAVGNLGCHFEISGRNKDNNGVSWGAGGGCRTFGGRVSNLTISRCCQDMRLPQAPDRRSPSPPTAAYPNNHLRCHAPAPLGPSSETILRPATPNHVFPELDTSHNPRPSPSTARCRCRRLNRRDALRHGLELGEVPEELRRRRSRREEDHASHRRVR